MPDFSDAADPDLADAATRLAAYREELTDDEIIDVQTGLSAGDIDTILRWLSRTKDSVPIRRATLKELAAEFGTTPASER